MISAALCDSYRLELLQGIHRLGDSYRVALFQAAASLGLTPAAVFRRVTLPQLRPAVLGGSLLVALHLVAEFGALALVRFPTLSTAVYDQFRSSFSGPVSGMSL